MPGQKHGEGTWIRADGGSYTGAWAQVPSLQSGGIFRSPKLPHIGGLLYKSTWKKHDGKKWCVCLMETKEKKVTWELNRCVGSCLLIQNKGICEIFVVGLNDFLK